jgi:multicomponent K+:H+ antiporter subunit A
VPEYSLAIWHGINAPLLMSIGGVIGGVGLYLFLRRYTDLHGDVRRSLGRSLFLRLVRGLQRTAQALTDALENGSLQRYLGLLVLAALALAVLPLWNADMFAGSNAGQPLPAIGAVICAMVFANTAAVLWLRRRRLLALIVLGGIGLFVSLVFALLSAPDLALTQLLVEMVTIALMLLALNYLPEETPDEEPAWRRWRDGLIALGAGGGIAAVVYAILTRPFESVSVEMLARSLSEGGGSNVVNVILVDFRGYDTLGEIAVFGLAGIVVHALLSNARMRPTLRIDAPADPLVIPNLVGSLLFPLALAVSVYMFLRGHNEPGGGFIAGLVLAVPLLLQYVLSGLGAVQARLPVNYLGTIAIGLLIATLTGIGSWMLGYPFLTSSTPHPVLPVFGEVPLASAMAFDLGVFLVVAGSALLALSTLGGVSLREPRARP